MLTNAAAGCCRRLPNDCAQCGRQSPQHGRRQGIGKPRACSRCSALTNLSPHCSCSARARSSTRARSAPNTCSVGMRFEVGSGSVEELRSGLKLGCGLGSGQVRGLYTTRCGPLKSNWLQCRQVVRTDLPALATSCAASSGTCMGSRHASTAVAYLGMDASQSIVKKFVGWPTPYQLRTSPPCQLWL